MLIVLKRYWSVRRILFLIPLLVFFSATCDLIGQDVGKVPLKVRKGSYVYINDSLHYFTYDTLLYLSNYLIPDNAENIANTRNFYDSLKVRAAKSYLGKRLYDMAIVLPPGESNQDIRTNINIDLSRHNGKTIRNISFRRLAPFGTNINNPDTSTAKGFSKLLNSSHITTKEIILRNYIFLKEGDRFSSFSAAESERILRRLKYIDDARIVIIPVGDDIIDIHIVTRDVYSLGLYYEVRGIKSGTIELFERSMFGLGHDFTLSFPYDYYKDYYGFGYGVSYNISNINKSFIDLKLDYSNSLGKEFYGLTISRPFITATTKYAGGFSINETFTSNDLDTLEQREPVEYNYLDTWFGRSFMIDSLSMTRAVISGRHINNNVYEKPEISSTSYHSLQRYKLYLISLSIVGQKFYKTNLLYNFGRTEDLPYGGKLDITYGKEFNEYNKREYFSIKASAAGLVTNIGYVYSSGKIGFFTKNSISEQGVLDFRLNRISNLTSVGRYRFRHFTNLRYTNGYKRFDNEYIRVDNNFGVRGYENDTLRPAQRLVLNLETVAFSPHYLYGFRFVFFGFTDIALISNSKFSSNYSTIAELGLGMRIRNDNLIFKTIQIRFSIFPFSPPYSEMRYLDITGEKLLEPPNFHPGAPAVIRYR